MKLYHNAVFLLLSSVLVAQTVYVDLEKQNLKVKDDNNKTIYECKITSGDALHPTPLGTFKILDKEKMHISNRYPINEDGSRGGARMPYAQRLTNSGIFLHAGQMEDFPSSHGCIRVRYGDSMNLFKILKIGDKVVIQNQNKFQDEKNQVLLALKKDEVAKKYKTLTNASKDNKVKQISTNAKKFFLEWIY